MRKLYALILWFTVTCAFAWNGAGTKENPYKISTPQDLVLLSDSVAAGKIQTGVYFSMLADLDMGGVRFNPIGNGMHTFEGNFDGGNHQIKNLRIVATQEYNNVGLFTATEGSVIEDLTIVESYFEGYDHVAAVVGYALKSTIRNCHNQSTVKGNAKYSKYIAGIVGELRAGKVEDCSNTGYITAEGTDAKYIAGVIGSTIGGSKVSGCFNWGTVKGTEHVAGVVGIVGNNDGLTTSHNAGVIIGTGAYTGGVAGEVSVGLVDTGGMTLCYNSGKVRGYSFVGGVAGYAAAVSTSCNVGEVSASGTGKEAGSNVGGVAGSGSVFNSYNRGTIKGDTCVGGVLGRVGKAENSYNLGTVSGKSNVGGVAGGMTGTACSMSNCYNASIVSASDNTLIGGVVGSIFLGGFANNNTIKNCYWDADVYPGKASSTNVEGNKKFVMQGKSSSEMKASPLAAALGTAFRYNAGAYPTLTGGAGSLNPESPNGLCSITATSTANGTALFTGTMEFASGSSLTYVVTPDKDYAVAGFKVDGVDRGHITSYTFDALAQPHTIDVTFGSASSLSEETAGYVVYPRATKDKFFIEGAAGNRVSLCDLTGKVVGTQLLATDVETMHTANLAKGIYLLRFEKGNLVATYKIVKQ